MMVASSVVIGIRVAPGTAADYKQPRPGQRAQARSASSCRGPIATPQQGRGSRKTACRHRFGGVACTSGGRDCPLRANFLNLTRTRIRLPAIRQYRGFGNAAETSSLRRPHLRLAQQGSPASRPKSVQDPARPMKEYFCSDATDPVRAVDDVPACPPHAGDTADGDGESGNPNVTPRLFDFGIANETSGTAAEAGFTAFDPGGPPERQAAFSSQDSTHPNAKLFTSAN